MKSMMTSGGSRSLVAGVGNVFEYHRSPHGVQDHARARSRARRPTGIFAAKFAPADRRFPHRCERRSRTHRMRVAFRAVATTAVLRLFSWRKCGVYLGAASAFGHYRLIISAACFGRAGSLFARRERRPKATIVMWTCCKTGGASHSRNTHERVHRMDERRSSRQSNSRAPRRPQRRRPHGVSPLLRTESGAR